MDRLERLKEYVKNNFTYSRYKENPNTYYDKVELDIVEHCKDIEWIIDEAEALYELVKANK